MRAVPALILAAVVAGCSLATPVMEPTHRWERPFAISPAVRGYVVHVQYARPEIGVRHLERSYRYERYEPVTGAWYPAELTHDGAYVFTDDAHAEIARAQGLPPPGT